MTDEQEEEKVIWTPSKMIERLGREIDNEESIYYWCAKVIDLLKIFTTFEMPVRVPSPIVVGYLASKRRLSFPET